MKTVYFCGRTVSKLCKFAIVKNTEQKYFLTFFPTDFLLKKEEKSSSCNNGQLRSRFSTAAQSMGEEGLSNFLPPPPPLLIPPPHPHPPILVTPHPHPPPLSSSPTTSSSTCTQGGHSFTFDIHGMQG